MNRRELTLVMLATAVAPALIFGSRPAIAQAAAPVQGRDFTLLEPPQPVPTTGKIEVLEFFSYACPHCAAFEPALESWSSKLAPDVVLRHVPVPFLFNAENFQHTYYALDELGLVDKMQRKIFQAIHVDRQRLDKPEEVATLVAKNGGDAKKFLDAFNSFSVATASKRASKMTTDYKIDSVPTLVIQGRYVTSPAQAGSLERSLAVAEALIVRARKG